jgi:hypothetical protein
MRSYALLRDDRLTEKSRVVPTVILKNSCGEQVPGLAKRH